MGLLDQLLGGGAGDEASRQDYQNFNDRYDNGAPHEGYEDSEVAGRYSDIAGQVDDDTYRQSAAQAFDRMSPDERAQFGQQLGQHAQSQGVNTGFDPNSADYTDSGQLADLTTRVHQQSPGLLSGLLGGGGSGNSGGGGSGNSGGGALGGLGGMLGGGGGGGLGGLLGGGSGGAGGLGGMLGGGGGLGGMLGGGGAGGGNPLLKAAMAGITAFAAKQMMNRR